MSALSITSPTSDIIAATLWVLIIFSVITWSIIGVKLWWQLRIAHRHRTFLSDFWNAQHLADCAQLQPPPSPLSHLYQSGLAVLQVEPHPPVAKLSRSGDAHDILERTLRQQVQTEQSRLESGLALLASIGSTAPFVGLFGTVWGIMRALEDIGRSGSAGLDVVAGPIGEALIATALGIATAIPAVLAYNYFLRRLRLFVTEMENFATDFLHLALRADVRIVQEN